MHNSDSFISEVSEEVRRDRLYAGMARYGWLIAALVLLVVGGAAGNAWYQSRQTAAARVAGDTLRAALAEPDAAKRAAALGGFVEGAPRAAALGQIAEAGSLAKAGDKDGAATLLATVAGDGKTPEILRALASLERVMLLGSTMDASERQAALEGLVAPGAPFRALALEQRALMALEGGNRDAAVADLNEALADPSATEALQGRARQLILAAGGSVTLPGAAAPAVDG